MIRFLCVLAIFIASLCYFIMHDNIADPSKLYDVAKFAFMPSFLALFPLGWSARHHIGTTISLLPNQRIRVSFAYLIQIKVKDKLNHTKYLLVENSKIKGGFQPVGGVYQYYDSTIHTKFNTKDHRSFHKKGDLRLEMSRKTFPAFLSYFREKENREISPNREFREELIDTGIFDSSLFANPRFSYIKQIVTPITFSDHFQIYEKKVFDIYNLNLDELQYHFIENLLSIDSKNYVFVSEHDIIRLGCSEDANRDLFRILPHTPYLVK